MKDKGSEEKRNPLLFLFGKTWRYSEGNRHRIIQYWIMFIIANTIETIAIPLIMAAIMNMLQADGITRSNIRMLCGLLLLTTLTRICFWALHGPARVTERNNAFRARGNYRKFLLKGVMTMPMEWHTEHHSGDTIDKIEKGTHGLFSFSEDSFEIIMSVVQLVISYGMLAYVSPPSALIVLVMIAVTCWITMKFDHVLIGQYKELSRAENHISESVFDAISNISTVIILRVERLVFGAIAAKIDKPYDLFSTNNALNETKWFLTSMCCSATTVIVLGVYFLQHIGTPKGVLIGSVFLLFKYLDSISNLFFRFTYMYGDIVQRKARVMNAEELTRDFRSENFSNHVLPENWRSIQIKDLKFSYNGTDHKDLHLENVSLTVNRGERIALVGKSGSGKTTLLTVMRSLYRPNNIELFVDGNSVAQGFDGICRAIALVPQDPEIFATTMRLNITLGADYSEATIRRFTDMARFSEVLQELPHGLESSTKEKGVNLSGGQKQRLALTRGLLACEDKSIVLLDEPTSSLDIVTEQEIYREVFSEFPDKAILSSVHKLHLLPMFDRIYLFDEGKIAAFGTFKELLESCPAFQELWRRYNSENQ
jgi:ABC-type multidrug transport system fused ATPase/permease subunit